MNYLVLQNSNYNNGSSTNDCPSYYDLCEPLCSCVTRANCPINSFCVDNCQQVGPGCPGYCTDNKCFGPDPY